MYKSLQHDSFASNYQFSMPNSSSSSKLRQSVGPSQVSGMKMRNLLFGVLLGLLAIVHSTPSNSKWNNQFVSVFISPKPPFSILAECIWDATPGE